MWAISYRANQGSDLWKMHGSFQTKFLKGWLWTPSIHNKWGWDFKEGPTNIWITLALKLLHHTHWRLNKDNNFLQIFLEKLLTKHRCWQSSLSSKHIWQIEGKSEWLGSLLWRDFEQLRALKIITQMMMLTLVGQLNFHKALYGFVSMGEGMQQVLEQIFNRKLTWCFRLPASWPDATWPDGWFCYHWPLPKRDSS